MLNHRDIWQALDRLAEANDLSPSALAKRAGLDPTTFNRSKRRSDSGKLRWPSTESIAKVLAATNTTIAAFVGLLDAGSEKTVQRVPIIGSAQAGDHGYFDDAGFPRGSGWDEVLFPDIGDPHAYALEISGDSMEPVFRDGDVVVVSPEASVRRGDRVVVRTREGEVMAKQLLRKTARRVDLVSLNPTHADRSLPLEDVEWIARIVWASQ